METENIVQILANALQPQEDLRNEAEKTIKTLLSNNYTELITVLIKIFVDNNIPSQIRHIGSIIVKNSLHSRNQRIQKGYESRWLKTPFELRIQMSKYIAENMNMKDKAILTNLSKILGSIIRIELVNGTEYDFFGYLLGLVKHKEYAVGILDTTYHACNQILDETDYIMNKNLQNTDKIHSIATFYLDISIDEPSIKISMLKCIHSSLEIYESVFNNDRTRREFFCKIFNFDMNNSEIVSNSLEIINRSIDIYENIPDSEITQISMFMQNFLKISDDVPIQIFEFYILLIDIEKYQCINACMPGLVVDLLKCIKKEEYDDTEWTSHKGACTLLSLLNDKLKTFLISNSECRDFVSKKLNSSDLTQRAIGYSTLACVAEAIPNDDFIYNSLELLFKDLKYQETSNEALFALSKICEKDISSAIHLLPAIIEACAQIITSNQECSMNAVRVYNSIIMAMKFKKCDEVEHIVLYHYTNMITALVKALESLSYDSYNIRNIITSTLSEIILICPFSHKDLLGQIEVYLYSRLEYFIKTINNSSNEQAILLDDVLCGLIVLLESILSMKSVVDGDKIIQTFIECLKLPEMTLRGEIYIVISKHLNHFSIHLKQFIPFVLRDLGNGDVFVLKSSLNLLSECATFLEMVFSEFLSVVIPALITAISSPEVPLSVKPEIIICIGEIALAVGKEFSYYIEMSIVLFTQINSLDRTDDEDFVDQLRKAVLKLFICIFVSLGNSNYVKNSISQIFENVRICILADVDSTYVKESVEIISDMESTVGCRQLKTEWIQEFLENTMRNQEGSILEKARETYEHIFQSGSDDY